MALFGCRELINVEEAWLEWFGYNGMEGKVGTFCLVWHGYGTVKILTFEACFSLDISVDVLIGLIPRWQASNHIQSLQSK